MTRFGNIFARYFQIFPYYFQDYEINSVFFLPQVFLTNKIGAASNRMALLTANDAKTGICLYTSANLRLGSRRERCPW